MNHFLFSFALFCLNLLYYKIYSSLLLYTVVELSLFSM